MTHNWFISADYFLKGSNVKKGSEVAPKLFDIPLIPALLMWFMAFLLNAPAYSSNTFLLFPEIRLDHQSGEHFSERNVKPAADIFFSRESDFYSLLGEFYLSESEQHFERVQIGLPLSESAVAWVGRYHNPYGYWHTQYHHGNYLQTSITRPSPVEFGADGGIIPSHFSGLLLEGRFESGESGWEYALAAGLASQIQTTGGGHHGGNNPILHDFDLLDPSPDDHEMGYTARLSYFPDFLGENTFGVFFTKATMLNDHSPKEKVEISAFGAYFNYRYGDLRVFGEAYQLSSDVPEHGHYRKGDIIPVYVQTEYALNNAITPYLRVVETINEDNDPYLELLSGYSENSETIGGRWDFLPNQAMKFEYTHKNVKGLDDDVWLINWSTLWP